MNDTNKQYCEIITQNLLHYAAKTQAGGLDEDELLALLDNVIDDAKKLEQQIEAGYGS